jgi:HNH endonuclease
MPRYRPCSICGKPANWNPKGGSRESPTCGRCRRHLRQYLCLQCGKQFDGGDRHSGREPKFCSKQCYLDSLPAYDKAAARKASSRARKLNKIKTWDGVPDREIYERAGGMCQLGSWCKAAGMPIDPEAPKTNELAPNVDHIIPLSLGGIDVSANKRAAHQICNVQRGNRMTSEEIAFMNAHPELLLAPEQISVLPSKKRPVKAPKPPRPVKICACEGCDAVLTHGGAKFCSDCATHANRHRMQQHYYTRRGLTPPEPWWAASGVTEHAAHS